MENKHYNASIVVAKSAAEAFKSINNVTKWWSESLEGDTHNLNGVFTIDWGKGNYVTFKLVELVPEKRVVWLVTDCNLNWLKNTTEWTDTKIVFDISNAGNQTKIDFAHLGLVPEVECYDMCVKGWDQYFKGSLHQLITEGKGQPQIKK